MVLICSSNCQSSAIQFEDRLIPCRPDFSRQTFLSGNGYYLFSHFQQLIINLKAANPNEILTSVIKIKFHFLIKALRFVSRFILSLVNKSRGCPPTISTLKWSRHVPECADGLQLQPAFFKWLPGAIPCHSRFQLLLNFVFNFHCLRTRFDADSSVSSCWCIALKQKIFRCTFELLGKNI